MLFGSAGFLDGAEVSVGDGAGSLDGSSAGGVGELGPAAVGVATSLLPPPAPMPMPMPMKSSARVAEAPDSFFGWDDAVDANLAAVMATQDAVILGRRSYTEWAQFWPSSQIEPFVTFINGSRSMSRHRRPLTKIGPIRRRSTAGWSNSFGISSSSAEAMSASTQVSRSRRRCSLPTLSTNSGSR
jgi:hypothetical protein